MAIDLLGTVAARLKHDAVVCQKEKFWIVNEFINGNHISAREACSVCLDLRNEKPVFVCEGCHRIFHLDCAGIGGNTISTQNLYCPICLYKKQLIALNSHCEAQGMEHSKINSRKSLQSSDIVTSSEIVQQMLLNFLEDAGDADVHLHTRWSVATSISSFLILFCLRLISQSQYEYAGFIFASGTKKILVLNRSFFITLQD